MKKILQKRVGFKLGTVIILASFFIFSQTLVFSENTWTGPGGNPTGNNVEPPINTSSIPQAKTGTLLLPELGFINSNSQCILAAKGNIRFNTTTNKLEICSDKTGTLGWGTIGQWDDVTGGINYAGGNVGIGTTSPGAKLEIANNGDLINGSKILVKIGDYNSSDNEDQGVLSITNANQLNNNRLLYIHSKIDDTNKNKGGLNSGEIRFIQQFFKAPSSTDNIHIHIESGADTDESFNTGWATNNTKWLAGSIRNISGQVIIGGSKTPYVPFVVQYSNILDLKSGSVDDVIGFGQRLARLSGWTGVVNKSYKAFYLSDAAVTGGWSNAFGPNAKAYGVYIEPDFAMNYFAGAVGIGVIEPTKKLDVAGDINFTGDLYKGGSLYAPTIAINDLTDAKTSNVSVYLGASSGVADNSDSYNTAVGVKSLESTTSSGVYNTSIGYNSLSSNTSGTRNVAIGLHSMALNHSGSYNTAVGMQSLYKSTGSRNTAVGTYAFTNSTGQYNTGVGYSVGKGASSNTGNSNTAMGYYTLSSLNTGSQNTAIGQDALRAVTSGFNNTAIGYNTGSGITTGSNNTILGANISAGNISDNIIIADGNGNQRIRILASGDVGIGTTIPSGKLDVNGGIVGDALVISGGAAIDTDTLYVDQVNNRVGVGTSSPADKLHVIGGGLRVSDSSNNHWQLFGGVNDNWAYIQTDVPKIYVNKEIRVDSGLIGSYNEDLSLRTSGTTRMTIRNSDGNVGIGTTSPSSKLDVAGDIEFSGTLKTGSGEVRCPAGQAMVGFNTSGIICEEMGGVYE